MLDGTTSLQGSTGVDKGVAVNGEGSVASRAAGHGWRSTTQRAGEGLDIGTVCVLANLDLGSGDGGRDLGRGGVFHEEILGDDAAGGVVGVVTGVSLAGGVVDLFSSVSPDAKVNT